MGHLRVCGQDIRRIFWLYVLISFLSCVALAGGQVNSGIPSFSAYDRHEVDTINLQNLNVLLTVPVMSKSGALPFNYVLRGDSFMAVTNGASGPTWGPAPPVLTGSVNGFLGLVWEARYSVQTSATCPGGGDTIKYSNWYVLTTDWTYHWLPVTDYTDSAECLNASFTDQVTDGTGFTVNASNSGFPNAVYDRSGLILTPRTITDSNGNNVSLTTGVSSNTWTDSLGLTAITATTSGNYVWTDINGGSPTVSTTNLSTQLETAFNCPGIADYIGLINAVIPTSLSFPDSTTLAISYEPTPGHSGHYTGRISQLTLRSGGNIAYGYLGGNNGIDCTYQVPPTLTRTTSDGTTTYAWAAITGGNTTTVTDNGGNKTIYQFIGGILTQVKHYQGTSTLLTTDVYCYNGGTGQPANCPTAAVSMAITETDLYHTINGMSNSSRTQTKYDKYGNITYSAQYDFGAASPTIATTTVYGTWNGTTCASVSSTINNKPCTVTTTANGSTVGASRFTYDSRGNLLTTYVSPNGGSSFLSNTTVNSYNSNGTPAAIYNLANNKTSYAYSSSSYTSCGSCTNYPFPTSISKGGLTTYSTWNGIGGVKLTDKDASNNTTTYGYENNSGVADPFWRISSTADPYGNTIWNAYYSNSKEVNFSFNGGSSINQVWYDWDGYGRPVSTQTAQSPGGTNYDTMSTLYTWSGSPPGYKGVTVSLPCSTSSGGVCSFSTATVSKIDPLGRVYTTKDGGSGLLTNTYSQNDVLSVLSPAPSGENVKQTQNQYDGLGRLTSSCKIESSGGTSCGQNTGTASGVVTTTSYTSASGSQTVSSTRGVQTRSKTFDGLGRAISSITPEAGTTTYTYDSAPCGGATSYPGHLTNITYANGTVNCYWYNDASGRMTDTKGKATSGSGYCKRWRYDNASNGVLTQPSGSTIANAAGRLVEAETDSTLNCALPITGSMTDEWFSYDKDGRMTDMWEKTPNSGQYYHSTATFNGNGTIATVDLASPSFYTLTYGLDGEGRWNSLAQGTTPLVPTTGVSYNAAGQPINIPIGSASDYDSYTYDSNTGRMTNWDFTVGTNSETAVLNWNANSTLNHLAITDGFNPGGTQTCYFNPSGGSSAGYDDLGRLLNDNCGSAWAQTFSYDQYDNLSQTGSISWGCTTCYNAANNHYNTTSSIYYDSGGNLLSDSFHKYAWDGYNKMASADASDSNCSTSGECLVYDALGRTVEIDSGSAHIEIWYTQAGKTAYMNGATISYAYWPTPGGGTLLETGNASSYYYLHKDWLGNARLSTDIVASTVIADRAFAPYGPMYGNVGATGQNQLMFTGDTQDVIAGIYDTPNREFAGSNQGRWLSPDPAEAGWNLYAYATNPNSFVDPTGMDDCVSDPYQGNCNGPGGGGAPGGGGGGSGGGNSGCLSCGNFGTGGWGSLGADEAAAEAAWLASGSIAWYSVQGGELYLSFAFWTPNPDYDPDASFSLLGTTTVELTDMGSASPDNGANNGSWAWNFTKSFFTGFSVFGPKNDPRPSCFGQFLSDAGSGFVNSFLPPSPSPGEIIGVGTAMYDFPNEVGIVAEQHLAQYGSRISKYTIGEQAGARAGVAGLLANADYQGAVALVNEYGSASSGQCK
jgi:RHS repeat-associated protein